MAALPCSLTVEGVTTNTSLFTIMQIKAPSNQRVRVRRIKVGFHGISNTAVPATVDWVLQSTAGTFTNTGRTPVKLDTSLPETVQTTGQDTATGEPTLTAILGTLAVHPQTSVDEPLDVILKGGGYFGVRITTAASTTADCTIEFEE